MPTPTFAQVSAEYIAAAAKATSAAAALSAEATIMRKKIEESRYNSNEDSLKLAETIYAARVADAAAWSATANLYTLLSTYDTSTP